MAMEANVEKMKNQTVAQAYEALYKQAATEKLRKETELAGELTPYQRQQMAQWGATHVVVDGTLVPASDVYKEVMSRRGERTVTVKGKSFTLNNKQAMDVLLDNLDKRSVTIDGQEFELPSKDAAKLVSSREIAGAQLGLAQTREARAERTAELGAATKRISTILNNYGEAGVTSITPEGVLTTGGTNKYKELVATARAKDATNEAKADLRSVARDMYNVRAPGGLLPKERFDDSVIELLEKGTVTLANGKVVKLPADGAVKIEDENGVFIKVKMDPSGMIKIVEVIG